MEEAELLVELSAGLLAEPTGRRHPQVAEAAEAAEAAEPVAHRRRPAERCHRLPLERRHRTVAPDAADG